MLPYVLVAVGLMDVLVGLFAASHKKQMGRRIAGLGASVVLMGLGQFIKAHGYLLLGMAIGLVGALGCIGAGVTLTSALRDRDLRRS